MRCGNGPNARQNLLAVQGQADLVTAPIGATATSLDQTVPLESIEHCHDPTGPYPDLLTESTLAGPRGASDQTQQPRVRGGDIQRPQRLLETVRGIGAELREQKGDSMMGLRSERHGHIIDLLINDSQCVSYLA